MFGSDYKKQCEALREQLAENCQVLEHINKHSDRVHIIKFVVDNPDQFMLDGDFVIDESKAVYGAHVVSFSEAVMFKAGKEAAHREFDILQANSDKLISELRDDVAKLENELNVEKLHNAELTQKCTDIQSMFNEKFNSLQSKLQSQLIDKDADILALKSDIETYITTISELRQELSEWQAGNRVDTPFPIKTEFGVVQEDK